MVDTERYRCPVCKASFRGANLCPRCGASLDPILRIAAEASALRAKAATLLQCGHFEEARQTAARAQRYDATETGRKLLLLIQWCLKNVVMDSEATEI
ncbi:MAG TPA: hypothetical protein PLL36_10800 [Candidatus Hydrogenedentes bacterium]|jgi:predicted amidophosphoribosyltransferase|nr:MAG: hypothetical protein BWX80_03715 [Candidatus Hydrogenedentes bacterium ADurb.Bin101]HQN01558.1 hypothetical protein [Candidatus Hydrogenedentota bacterium]